jgi:hypothetical protein
MVFEQWIFKVCLTVEDPGCMAVLAKHMKIVLGLLRLLTLKGLQKGCALFRDLLLK